MTERKVTLEAVYDPIQMHRIMYKVVNEDGRLGVTTAVREIALDRLVQAMDAMRDKCRAEEQARLRSEYFEPTSELRWHYSKESSVAVLQQKYIVKETGLNTGSRETEWRNVDVTGTPPNTITVKIPNS